MSQTLVTSIFKKTGEIVRPTAKLAYRLNISRVVKSIADPYILKNSVRELDANTMLHVPIYLICELFGN